MQKHRTGSSGLFLMELLLSILMFAIASAICLQIFARAHSLSQEAAALDFGTNLCVSAAEVLSACESSDETEDLLTGHISGLTVSDDGSLAAYYDKELTLLSDDGSQAAYRLQIIPDDSEADTVAADIRFDDLTGETPSEIYSLSARHYVRRDRYE